MLPTELIVASRAVLLGTCESAVCVLIEYESNRALRFEFESNLESTRPFILYTA